MALKRHRDLLDYSAYQGGAWRPRRLSHDKECGTGIWPGAGIDSEYSQLTEVLLFRPGPKSPELESPEAAQFLEHVQWNALRKEISRLEAIFRKQGVAVHYIDPHAFGTPPPNLVFVRDLFFMTPWGAILARMAGQVRSGEEKWVQLALARLGVPLLHAVRGRGTFEGADALWIRPDVVFVGVGNRTNIEGFRQVQRILSEFAVTCIPFSLPRRVQHLLGLLQIIGPKTALLRERLASRRLCLALRRYGYGVVAIDESEEVERGQAMNIVTIRENTVIMPEDCPKLRAFFESSGIEIVGTTRIRQLVHAAGGIACATGILTRKLSHNRAGRRPARGRQR